jgi:hypothetical protein
MCRDADNIIIQTVSRSDSPFLITVKRAVRTRKFCDLEVFDFEVFTDSYVFGPRGYEQVVSILFVICMYVCIYASASFTHIR